MKIYNKEPYISVGLFDKTESLEFRLNGSYILHNTNQILSGDYKALIINSKIEIIDSTKKTIIIADKIIIFPENIEKNRMMLMNVIIGIGFHWEQKKKF